MFVKLSHKRLFRVPFPIRKECNSGLLKYKNSSLVWYADRSRRDKDVEVAFHVFFNVDVLRVKQLEKR